MSRKLTFIYILVFSLFFTACSSQRLVDSDTGKTVVGSGEGKMEEADMVYVEEETPLPDDFGLADVVKMKERNGKLWIFRSQLYASGAAWILENDGSWQDATEEWMSWTIEDQEGGPTFYLSDYAEIPDGGRLLLFSRTGEAASEKEYRMQKLTALGERKEVVLDFPSDILNGRIRVLSNGNLVIWDKMGSHFYIYEDGQQTYKQEVIGLGSAGIYELPDGNLVFRPNRNEGLHVMNGAETHTEEWLPSELYKGVEIRESVLAEMAEDEWLFANHNGVYEKKNGNIEWEQIISASHCSLYFDNFYIGAIQPVVDGFYVASESELYFYQKKQREQKEQIILTVVIPGAADNFLKLAAVQFMQKHPEVDVVFEELEPNETVMGDKLEEAMQKLNVRIIAGEQLDVVVLNGLPWETYGAKGILEDLTLQLTQKREDGEILDNVMSAMEQEGKLYAVPLSFTPILRECDQSEAKNFVDIDSFLTYLKESERNTGFLLQGGYNKENTLDEALYMIYGHCLYRDDGSLDERQLRSYLECWRILRTRAAELNIAQKSFGEFSIGEVEYREEKQLGGFAIVLDNVRSQFGVSALRDTYVENSGLFCPGIILGVGMNSAHKDVAIDFVMFCLEQKVQEKQDFMFPVHCQAAYEVMKNVCQLQETMIEKMRQRGESIEEISQLHEEDIELEWELAKKVFVKTDNIKGLVNAKPVRYQIILERAQGWLNGDETLEESVDNIFSALKMYEDEQK